MLKWVQTLMGENPLPMELRTQVSEKSVLRAIENQKQVVAELESKAHCWEAAGELPMRGGPLLVIDPHWYQNEFDPYLDEPYWVMAELEAPVETMHVAVMVVGNKPIDRSVGRVRLLMIEDAGNEIERERVGAVDLECYNLMMAASREGVRENWRNGGPLNKCLLDIEERSRRQHARDHQRAMDLLGRMGYTLKPLSHGYAREFERPLLEKDLQRVRDLLIEADIPAHLTCETAQTFAEVDQIMAGCSYAPVPDKERAWAWAFDVPSDGVIFALRAGGQVIGYEVDFIAGLREVFERQRDLIYKSLGKMFQTD